MVDSSLLFLFSARCLRPSIVERSQSLSLSCTRFSGFCVCREREREMKIMSTRWDCSFLLAS